MYRVYGGRVSSSTTMSFNHAMYNSITIINEQRGPDPPRSPEWMVGCLPRALGLQGKRKQLSHGSHPVALKYHVTIIIRSRGTS
jgi:hypothetical protein